MQVSNNYITVVKHEEPKEDGFVTAEVQDNFVYKGKVTNVPESPVYLGNKPITIGDIVLFAKYSPDTHEIDLDGVKVKFVAVSDLLAVI